MFSVPSGIPPSLTSRPAVAREWVAAVPSSSGANTRSNVHDPPIDSVVPVQVSLLSV